MKFSVARLTDAGRWRRLVASRLETWKRNRGDDSLDSLLSRIGPVTANGDRTIIADGLWRNPNHFFRLRLFVEALTAKESYTFVGILRRKSDHRQKRALERIGFREFVYIEDDVEFRREAFLDEANRMLAHVSSHRQMSQLRLPKGLPAYTFFDTVLKIATDPQPTLGSPLWRDTLADILRDLAIYERELGKRDVAHVVLSHPWKGEYASLVWLALSKDIPAYHLTAFCDAIRVRRFSTTEDYATPVEHLPFSSFKALPVEVREQLSLYGHDALRRRASGQSSDVNAKHAYDPSQRVTNRQAARELLSGQTTKPVIVVYGHVWYDFPHTFAMQNFSDFLDWIKATLHAIRELDQFVWLLKPHPTERWYGGYKLADAIRDLPGHVRLLPTQTDSLTAVTAADAVVTVHGTIGLEAAARGVPVILADRSYFSDWNIGYVAQSREHYAELLASAGHLIPPDQSIRNLASACFALALGEPPPEAHALQISCDTGGSQLYKEIEHRFTSSASALRQEVSRLDDFLGQNQIDSFAAYHLVKTAFAARSAA